MKKIILASSSPRRKQLLKLLGLEFTIDASNIEEKLNPRLKPRKQVEVLSSQKAQAIASKYPDAIIIAADTMVAFGDEKLGKPKDAKDAKQMLKKLSGTVHFVVTGMTVLDTATKKSRTSSIETTIMFRKLQDKEIAKFIEKEKPYDKAGAYAIHELGGIFVERVEGDYLGAVGLSLFALARELKKFGVSII
ncbi:MAG: Maf family protein [Patescibacteria group bacterium]